MSESKAKRAAREYIEKARKVTIKRHVEAGTIVEIFIGESLGEEIRKCIQRALSRGETVEFPDGSQKWREHRIELRDGEGSDRYVWHADGNRVLARLVEVTIQVDGTRSEEAIRRVWVRF